MRSLFPLFFSILKLKLAVEDQAFRYSRLAHAVIAGQGRSDGRNGRQAALGGTLSFEALLAVEEHVVADCACRVGFGGHN